MDRDLQALLARWIETDRQARLIVSNDLRPVWLSAAAEEMLSQPDGVLYCNGRLRPRSPNVDRELRSLVTEATKDVATHCITDARTGEHVVLSTMRVDEMVVITLRRPEHREPLRLINLRQAFGLTDAEHAVAERLMNGRTAEATAEELGVGIETIRTHIKRIYAKLEVCSREALFHRLRSYVSETQERSRPRTQRWRSSGAYAEEASELHRRGA